MEHDELRTVGRLSEIRNFMKSSNDVLSFGYAHSKSSRHWVEGTGSLAREEKFVLKTNRER